MYKYVVTDFDETLIKINSEYEFLKFFIFSDENLGINIRNFINHFYTKYLSRLKGHIFTKRYFYKDVNTELINLAVKKFVQDNKTANFNNTIKNYIDHCEKTIIVTTCSRQIAKPIIDYYFKNHEIKIFASVLEEKNNTFTGNLTIKITPKLKKKILIKYFEANSFSFDEAIAFGNHPKDKYMLSLFKRSKFI